MKITFTYYGGDYHEKTKQVRFHQHPTSVFTPRLRVLRPILKTPSKDNKYFDEERCFTDNNQDEIEPLRPGSDSQLLRRNLMEEPSSSVSYSETAVIKKEDRYFKSKVPFDFEEQCLRAIHELLVVKEQVIKSKLWLTKTEMTFARKKKSRWQVFQTSLAMDAFYTSPLFLSSLSIISPGKSGFDLTVL